MTKLYSQLRPHEIRVVKELDDLVIKVDALTKFLASEMDDETPDVVTPPELDLLVAQHGVMISYAITLSLRIEDFWGDFEGMYLLNTNTGKKEKINVREFVNG